MPRFAANLTTMYTEYPFLDRFAAAAADGFEAVEFLFPYEYPAEVLAAQLMRSGVRQVLFNAPPGDWKAQERGIAALPGRTDEFREGFERAIEYARVLNCPRVHVMAGIVSAEASREAMLECYRDNLGWAASQAGSAGIDVLIEPIAGRNMPGYFLNRQDQAHRIVTEIGNPNLKVQMDLFHCQIEQGDLSANIRRYLSGPSPSRVGHLQIAGVPDRHEPDSGEVDYDYIFELLDSVGFDGWLGCEYVPRAGTSKGLIWFGKWAAREA